MVMDRKQLRLCKVCCHTKVGHGNEFCEACRSFYIRNRKRGSLPCKNDNLHYKCLQLEGDESIEPYCILYKGGVNRRLLCPGCRLEKCKKLKSLKNNNNATRRTSTATTYNSKSSSLKENPDTFHEQHFNQQEAPGQCKEEKEEGKKEKEICFVLYLCFFFVLCNRKHSKWISPSL